MVEPPEDEARHRGSQELGRRLELLLRDRELRLRFQQLGEDEPGLLLHLQPPLDSERAGADGGLSRP